MSAGTATRAAAVFVAALAGIVAATVPAFAWVVGPVALFCALVAARYLPELRDL